MIVQCIQEETSDESRPFEEGKKYFVLGIIFGPTEEPPLLTLEGDNDWGPILIEITKFKIVDERIPPDWGARPLLSGEYRLSHLAFAGDFWDRYHDDDEQALRLYEQVYEEIKTFHSGL